MPYLDHSKDIHKHVNYSELLYLYKKQNNKESANQLFKQREWFTHPDYEEIDVKNYQNLIQKILQKKSKVLSLQYPNQSNWIVLDAISPFRDSVDFISLANLIEEQLHNQSVIDLFEDDFMHLNEFGAELISTKLSEAIALRLSME